MMKRIPSDWLLPFAWACPVVIFVCMLIGWRLSNRLYTDVDGAFARWNFVYAFEWGHWFDLAIFNPFAGLGSTFWSNTPWLNPGALALQLPFSPLATVTLSYLAQLAAYALTPTRRRLCPGTVHSVQSAPVQLFLGFHHALPDRALSARCRGGR
jgi:hypothetical protein